MITQEKKIMPIKVSPIIVAEFDQIQEEEGFGSRASTFSFLVKSYHQRKYYELEKAADELDKVIDKVDKKKIPSLKKQLGL